MAVMRRLLANASIFILAAGVPVMAQGLTFENDSVGSPPKGWL
jgi:hypothetical protein